MKIQVLGSGCPSCHKLYEMTQDAAKQLNIADPVEYLTGDKGIQKIIELGSMGSPVLAIDDRITMVGFTPDIEIIKELLVKGGNKSGANNSGCSCGGNC